VAQTREPESTKVKVWIVTYENTYQCCSEGRHIYGVYSNEERARSEYDRISQLTYSYHMVDCDAWEAED